MFIVIDGIDGSGKATQVKTIKEKLEKGGKKVLTLDYPRYDNNSSYGVVKYLNGKYGSLNRVSPYQASTLYAYDRLDDYLENIAFIKDNYDYILTDRYTTSSLIHQMSRIKDSNKKEIFKKWLIDLEYNKLGLLKPDLVFFLDVPASFALFNIDKRGNKKDKHENKEHLEGAYKSGLSLVDSEKEWIKIKCLKSKREMLSVDDISDNIIGFIQEKQ